MDRLKSLGFEVELRKVGTQECNGTEIPHPPVILASKGNDPKKMNLCVYGHLDVQPAKRVSLSRHPNNNDYYNFLPSISFC